MTRAERDRRVRLLLDRYDHKIGQTVVGDDAALVRLLVESLLNLDRQEAAVLLRPFLVA